MQHNQFATDLLEAAREALRRWDEAVPHIEGAIVMATIHHCPYKGPNVDEAMDRLRVALELSEDKV